jgi:hypothetical protein
MRKAVALLALFVEILLHGRDGNIDLDHVHRVVTILEDIGDDRINRIRVSDAPSVFTHVDTCLTLSTLSTRIPHLSDFSQVYTPDMMTNRRRKPLTAWMYIQIVNYGRIFSRRQANAKRLCYTKSKETEG